MRKRLSSSAKHPLDLLLAHLPQDPLQLGLGFLQFFFGLLLFGDGVFPLGFVQPFLRLAHPLLRGLEAFAGRVAFVLRLLSLWLVLLALVLALALALLAWPCP